MASDHVTADSTPMDPTLPIQLTRPVAFIDLETTGLNRSRDRIVELALLILYPDGRTIDRVRRFNPGIPIPPEATAVHGISDHDVAGEAPFKSRARSLAAVLEECDLAGFNIRGFDLPILLEEFRRSGVPFDIRGRGLIDAQMIFHRQEPRDLAAAARFYLDDDHADAHSARGDVLITARVLAAQLSRYADLPAGMDGLHAYCDQIRPFETAFDKWFSGSGPENYVFRRGKHQGKRLAEVAARSPDYLDWMLGAEDMPGEVLDVVREALERHDARHAPGGAAEQGQPGL